MTKPENWPADILQTFSQPAVPAKPINAVSCHAQLTHAIDFPINFKFSSWFRLVRITAFVCRAVRIFRQKLPISFFTTIVPHTCRIHKRKDQTSTVFTNAKFFPVSAVKSEQSLRTNSRIKTLTPYTVRMDSSRAHGAHQYNE